MGAPLSNLDAAKISAAAMLAMSMPELFSEHEEDLLREACGRFLQFGWATPVTEAEWAAIEPVLVHLPLGGRMMLGGIQ